MSRKKGDIVAGFFVVLLGAVAVFGASRIPGGAGEQLPPQALPYAVGFMLLAGGAGLAWKSWRYSGPDLAVKWPDRDGKVRIAVNLLMMALFIGLIDPLGMPVATAAYVAAAIAYIDRKRYIAAPLAGLGSALIVYYLFIKFLELQFPLGLLQR